LAAAELDAFMRR